MLKYITSKSQITKCQAQLQKAVKLYLPSKERYTIGYHSGSMVAPVYHDSNIWFSHTIVHTKDKRNWNAFGLTKDLSKSKSNSIVVEVNILQNGVNGRVAGSFVKDEASGTIYLAHSGKVGGGRKGIGKSTFLKWYKTSTKTVLNKNDKPIQEIIIGDILSKTFVQELSKFVKNVEKFKRLAAAGEINEATILTDKELEEKALKTSLKRKPKKGKSIVTVYERNKFIAEHAKRKAKGKCQLCLKNAPFKNKAMQPYLEAHHIVWLSKGGVDSIENTVALCPNCHKKMHIVNSTNDINKLKRAAKKT